MVADGLDGIDARLRLRVTLEPQIRYTQDGEELAEFRGTIFDTGALEPETVIVRITTKHETTLFRWVRFGAHVLARGRLSLKRWVDRAGVPHAALLLEAAELFPLDPPSRDPARAGISVSPERVLPVTRPHEQHAPAHSPAERLAA